MRELDKKIAEWSGWTYSHRWRDAKGKTRGLPLYSVSDSDAISLLPVLIERWCSYSMHYNPFSKKTTFQIHDMKDAMRLVAEGYQPTISAAICAAITELIEKEGKINDDKYSKQAHAEAREESISTVLLEELSTLRTQLSIAREALERIADKTFDADERSRPEELELNQIAIKALGKIGGRE